MVKKILKYTALLSSFAVLTGIFAFITIHILIKNQPVVVVPDLTGKDINYCINQLESLSLTPRIKNAEFSVSVPAEHIIEQMPEPGEFVKKGRDVHLTISRGKKSDIMPKLSDLTIDEARLDIMKTGLVMDHISYSHHAKIPAGTIITSVPQAGVPVKTGTKVNILVSLGKWPAEYIMPDLTGMTIEQATEELTLRRLEVSRISTTYSDSFNEGVILSQSPQQGVKVHEKDQVALVLNQKDSPSIISPVIGCRAVSYKVPFGLLRSHVKAEMEIYDRAFTVHDDYYKPGTIITILVPFDQNAVVKIYRDGDLAIEKKLKPFKDIKKNKFLNSSDFE